MLPEDDEDELDRDPPPQKALRPDSGLRVATWLPTVINARSIPSSSAIRLCISGDKDPPRTTRSPNLTWTGTRVGSYIVITLHLAKSNFASFGLAPLLTA